MPDFIHDDFLLQSEFSRRLYHDYAEPQPIIDYHNHLPPAEIAADRVFDNLTAVWLDGDHYKWRAMRALGIDEKYITGNADPVEKFRKWAAAVPATIRNPLFHWTHLELKRYFGFSGFLNPSNADVVYEDCNRKLSTAGFSTRSLIKQMNVALLCTTDDPTDDLQHHEALKKSTFQTKVYPAFRPDKAYAVDNPAAFNGYLARLESASGITIKTYAGMIDILLGRIAYFHDRGCRLADHGVESLRWFDHAPASIETIFKRLRKNETVPVEERQYFRSCVLLELCRVYHSKGWVQQFHLGALRNTNSRMFERMGADTGFDSIGDFQQASGLAGFLNALDRSNQLAKTVLYNLNPSDNEVMATMTGNFNDGSIKGKMQYGSAWWFLDQRDGMEKQINALSNLGILSSFIGMLTDSRSFLSFPRHEYFRRVLCNLLGNDVVKGELPSDEKWLGKIVADICYTNARAYFTFP